MHEALSHHGVATRSRGAPSGAPGGAPRSAHLPGGDPDAGLRGSRNSSLELVNPAFAWSIRACTAKKSRHEAGAQRGLPDSATERHEFTCPCTSQMQLRTRDRVIIELAVGTGTSTGCGKPGGSFFFFLLSFATLRSSVAEVCTVRLLHEPRQEGIEASELCQRNTRKPVWGTLASRVEPEGWQESARRRHLHSKSPECGHAHQGDITVISQRRKALPKNKSSTGPSNPPRKTLYRRMF